MSKMIEDLGFETEWVMQGIHQYKAEAARRLGEQWGSVEAGTKALWMLDILAKDLDHGHRAMVEADERHLLATNPDTALREERDTAAKELRRVYLRAREAYVAIHGENAAEKAGFERVADRVPHRFRRRVEHLVKSLAKTKAPEVRESFLRPLDHKELIAALMPLYKRLAAALDALGSGQRRAEGTRIGRREALARHRAELRNAVGVCVQLFNLAGMTEEASRLRPTVRRRARRKGEEERLAGPGGRADVQRPLPEGEDVGEALVPSVGRRRDGSVTGRDPALQHHHARRTRGVVRQASE